jgi:hypothetical protein
VTTIKQNHENPVNSKPNVKIILLEKESPIL